MGNRKENYVLIGGIKWTPQLVREKITTSDKAVKNALLRVYGWQTDDEQRRGETREHNNRGFNGRDSEILSSFAEQLKTKGWLSVKQIALARKKLVKYSGQIFREHILPRREEVYERFGV